MIQTGRWRQCPDCHQLIPIAEWDSHVGYSEQGSAAYIQGDIESFVSPIDKTVISDRRQLRAHMAKHGVTDSRDYSAEYMQQKARERHNRTVAQDREGRRQRVQHIIEAIERNQHG